MKTETIDTMIRHFKGIVAALEKEKSGTMGARNSPLEDVTFIESDSETLRYKRKFR